MASHITVGTARKKLFRLVNPRDENDPRFLQILNEVSERFIDDATYKGNIVNAYFETDTQGQITCPWFMDSIMAACVNGAPVPTYSEWHRYVEVGPGLIQPDTMAGYPFYDLGDKFCTVADIPAGDSGLLRVAITSSQDVNKTVRIFGRDADNNDIIGPDNELGELVVLAMPTVLTTLPFFRVTGVIKAASVGYVTLAWMDGATPNTLSVYQPCETIPLYHRYQIGTVALNQTLTNQTIAIQGRRRYVEMTSENDRVYPPSYGALKMGILATITETAPSDNLRATAQNYWGDSFGIAGKLTKKSKGSSRKMLNFSPRGAGVLPVRNSH
jgi:hypothetical protein